MQVPLYTASTRLQIEYNATQVDDRKQIIYLERSPEQVWLAEAALAWRPRANYAVVGVLLLGAGLLLWSQRSSSATLKW